MKKTIIFVLFCLFGVHAMAQVDAMLMRYPDVSKTHITFAYGDDIWIVPKAGGAASRLSSPAGGEIFPRFSPDGMHIAYTANYSGNDEVYVVDYLGGIPERLTFHSMNDRVIDWTPDGSSVLFASSRNSGRQRYNQFYKIDIQGGLPEKLPVPYGEFGSISPDGSKIAYTDRSRVFRTWKRYRGGTAPDIHIFDLNTFETKNITTNDANDEIPMWHGNSIYFLSDQGENLRANIWRYDVESGETEQLTFFKDFDVHFPAIGPEELVFEAGGKIYLMDLENHEYNEVNITVITDQTALVPTIKSAKKYIQTAQISPDGKRAIIQARGELFSVPAEEGVIINMSQTAGAAERYPAWSPDGKHIACWSDANGEYQLVLYSIDKPAQPRTLTAFKDGYRYNIFWSPDSKKLAYVDQGMQIQYIDVTTNAVVTIGNGISMFEGALRGFEASWSPDSKYITYSRSLDNQHGAVFIYDTESKQKRQVTSGFYNDFQPVFSADGKYLFYHSNRTFSPVYSDLDNTFVYPNATNLMVVALTPETESILKAKNDEVKVEEEKEENGEDEKKKKKDKKKDDNGEEAEDVKVTIDYEHFENRAEMLPLPAGNYGKLRSVEGKLIYVHYPNSGSDDAAKPALKYYDIEAREAKTIMEGARAYEVSANGKKLLVGQNGQWGIVDVAEGQKIKDALPTSDLQMTVAPQVEWQQIFNDAWRFERDFFYDPNMHGVDWPAMKARYGALIKQASARSDVNFILGELIAELNASHTYRGGGDNEEEARLNVGYLGIDWEKDGDHYTVGKILRGAAWDAEAQSPLAKTGISIKEGDYILAVNGMALDGNKSPYAAFQGLGGKKAEITYNSTASMTGAKHVVVELMNSETRLRHLAWIENNRKHVEERTDGKIGYIYVRSTGIDGQNELIRQFRAQIDKEGLIVDERFNSGGQIPDRFIEMLDRKPLAYWAVRDGKDWQWPPTANFGPKVMLINGFSGSGGDAFPDYFRKAGIGPLVGTRTWGGLIGISGAPGLIDNGRVTVPTFRMYDPNGDWFKEGHGVDPDVEVMEDFEKLANGTDVQLEAGIDEVIRLLNEKGHEKPDRPAYETR
ncbi:MAG TPA: peptidase S41 [Cytophagales bacterium]|jgi:tricorn protease|nr:peptidase S41 [Cytophagales bacterium]